MIALSYQLIGRGSAQCDAAIGRERATLIASYLSDALSDLCDAVIGILRGQRETRATFTEEPGQYRCTVILSNGWSTTFRASDWPSSRLLVI